MLEYPSCHQLAQTASLEMGAGMGSEIEIEIDGVDEMAAMAALRALIDGRFGEGE